jgi:hypothetical protein
MLDRLALKSFLILKDKAGLGACSGLLLRRIWPPARTWLAWWPRRARRTHPSEASSTQR